jgi:cell division protein FtsB
MIFKKGFWLLGIGVFFLAVFLPSYTKLQELRERNQELRAHIKKLQIENSLMEQELKRVEHDPLYQEKIAREKMGVVRKGEIPLKIVPQEAPEQKAQ